MSSVRCGGTVNSGERTDQREGQGDRVTYTESNPYGPPYPDCEWCNEVITPDQDTVDREASTHIGKMVPLHVECAAEFDAAD